MDLSVLDVQETNTENVLMTRNIDPLFFHDFKIK